MYLAFYFLLTSHSPIHLKSPFDMRPIQYVTPIWRRALPLQERTRTRQRPRVLRLWASILEQQRRHIMRTQLDGPAPHSDAHILMQPHITHRVLAASTHGPVLREVE